MAQHALALSTATTNAHVSPAAAPGTSASRSLNMTLGCVAAVAVATVPLLADVAAWAGGAAPPLWRWGVDILVPVGVGLGVAWTLRSMAQRVRRIRRDMLTLSMGDMRASIQVDARDALGGLQKELANLQLALTDIIRAVRHASNEVVHSAIEIEHGARDVAARAESSAAALEESSAALEQTWWRKRPSSRNPTRARPRVAATSSSASCKPCASWRNPPPAFAKSPASSTA